MSQNEEIPISATSADIIEYLKRLEERVAKIIGWVVQTDLDPIVNGINEMKAKNVFDVKDKRRIKRLEVKITALEYSLNPQQTAPVSKRTRSRTTTGPSGSGVKHLKTGTSGQSSALASNLLNSDKKTSGMSGPSSESQHKVSLAGVGLPDSSTSTPIVIPSGPRDRPKTQPLEQLIAASKSQPPATPNADEDEELLPFDTTDIISNEELETIYQYLVNPNKGPDYSDNEGTDDYTLAQSPPPQQTASESEDEAIRLWAEGNETQGVGSSPHPTAGPTIRSPHPSPQRYSPRPVTPVPLHPAQGYGASMEESGAVIDPQMMSMLMSDDGITDKDLQLFEKFQNMVNPNEDPIYEDIGGTDAYYMPQSSRDVTDPQGINTPAINRAQQQDFSDEEEELRSGPGMGGTQNAGRSPQVFAGPSIRSPQRYSPRPLTPVPSPSPQSAPDLIDSIDDEVLGLGPDSDPDDVRLVLNDLTKRIADYEGTTASHVFNGLREDIQLLNDPMRVYTPEEVQLVNAMNNEYWALNTRNKHVLTAPGNHGINASAVVSQSMPYSSSQRSSSRSATPVPQSPEEELPAPEAMAPVDEEEELQEELETTLKLFYTLPTPDEVSAIKASYSRIYIKINNLSTGIRDQRNRSLRSYYGPVCDASHGRRISGRNEQTFTRDILSRAYERQVFSDSIEGLAYPLSSWFPKYVDLLRQFRTVFDNYLNSERTAEDRQPVIELLESRQDVLDFVTRFTHVDQSEDQVFATLNATLPNLEGTSQALAGVLTIIKSGEYESLTTAQLTRAIDTANRLINEYLTDKKHQRPPFLGGMGGIQHTNDRLREEINELQGVLNQREQEPTLPPTEPQLPVLPNDDQYYYQQIKDVVNIGHRLRGEGRNVETHMNRLVAVMDLIPRKDVPRHHIQAIIDEISGQFEAMESKSNQ